MLVRALALVLLVGCGSSDGSSRDAGPPGVSDAGDVVADAGNVVEDAGAAPPDSGDVATDTGLASPDSGDARADTGALPDAAAPIGDPVRGGTLYTANCAACHGAEGRGMGGGTNAPSLRTASVQQAEPFTLASIIREGQGEGQMPAFGAVLTAGDIDDVIAFVHTWD